MRSFTGTGAFSLAGTRHEAILRARRRKKSRSRESRTIVVRVAIASVAFAALVATGWYMGSRAPSSVEPPEVLAAKAAAKHVGRIVVELPDGTRCRYTRFDNATGRMDDGTTQVCEDVARKRAAPTPDKFSWGKQQQ